MSLTRAAGDALRRNSQPEYMGDLLSYLARRRVLRRHLFEGS